MTVNEYLKKYDEYYEDNYLDIISQRNNKRYELYDDEFYDERMN
jgi:hypothetical protein